MLQATALLRPGGLGLTAGRAELPLTQTALSVNFSHAGGDISSRVWGRSVFTGEGAGGLLCCVCWGSGIDVKKKKGGREGRKKKNQNTPQMICHLLQIHMKPV